MIGLEDRQSLARDIDIALHAGARLRVACATAGIHVRTLQRWKTEEGLTRGDRRPEAMRPRPAHALTAAERTQVLEVANEVRFAALPPARIVPMLADEGVYLASHFVHWYNVEHRHSGIRYMSPAQRHAGADQAILAARHALYIEARERHPARWSRHTRNWSPADLVTLNSERESVVAMAMGNTNRQPLAA